MSKTKKQFSLDVTTCLLLIQTAAAEEVRPVIEAAIDEIDRLRTIEAAVIEATNATDATEKQVAWKKLIDLCS